MLRLVVGNLNYSSWSMRAWLVLARAGVEFDVHDIGLFTTPDWRQRLGAFSGALKVPILVDGSLTVHESLAIAETIAERFPEAGLWPADASLRARARALSAEMATGFAALRSQMPTNLRGRAEHTPASEDLARETARVFEIFQASLSTSTGKFLLGEWGIVDCMYMPVLSRFRTYGVRLPPDIQAYSDRVFAHPLVRELEELAQGTGPIVEYDGYLTASG